jgi:hypothetical protein
MSPDVLVIWGQAAIVAVCVSGGVSAFVLGPHAIREWREYVWPLLRKVFTKVGDHDCPCCSQWSQPIFCPTCQSVRVLTPTSTLPAPSELSKVADLRAYRRAQDEQRALDALDPLSARVN